MPRHGLHKAFRVHAKHVPTQLYQHSEGQTELNICTKAVIRGFVKDRHRLWSTDVDMPRPSALIGLVRHGHPSFAEAGFSCRAELLLLRCKTQPVPASSRPQTTIGVERRTKVIGRTSSYLGYPVVPPSHSFFVGAMVEVSSFEFVGSSSSC
jgi:hypothetical protein